MFGRTKMLENLLPPKQKRSCKVRTVMDELDQADAAILEAAVMDAKNWKIRTLEKELLTHGIQLSETPILRHRTKACSCWKN